MHSCPCERVCISALRCRLTSTDASVLCYNRSNVICECSRLAGSRLVVIESCLNWSPTCLYTTKVYARASSTRYFAHAYESMRACACTRVHTPLYELVPNACTHTPRRLVTLTQRLPLPGFAVWLLDSQYSYASCSTQWCGLIRYIK